jgi:hypothetical protein
VQRSVSPLVICGDFNLIRYAHEKSIGTSHTIWMDIFNNFINDTALIEMKDGEASLLGLINKIAQL